MAMPSKSNENVEFEELKNLPANMNYNVWCYANNNSQVESSYKATEFETYEAANSVRFIVKFWADIPIEYLDIIGNELAFILGISPLRL